MKKDNCWDCPELKATVGGWHCEEHNVFLHEQTHPNDVGHGGNGCVTYIVEKVYIPVPIHNINVTVRIEK